VSKVLSLAVRVTGDASRLNLTPVERALKGLEAETEKVGKVFKRFATESEAGAKAQRDFQKASDELNASLKSKIITPQEFAAAFEKLGEAATKEAAALEQAARITEQNLTAFEKFTRTQRELAEQLERGRISQETYNRAVESAAKGLTDAERAAAGLAARTAEVAKSGKDTTLRFNELSGVFAILPGPLGNIAGRISGITSASEGLSRVFSGGLAQGVSNLVGSFTALVNPVTAGLAAITGFAAGAAAVTRGLVSLEDRVERLGNLANQLGVSFGFVQVLEEAGKRTGVSVQQLEGAFARLQGTLAGGGEESKKATEALNRLGLSVQQLEGLTQQQQIELFGKQIASIQNPAERSAAAIALFGRSGVQLLPFFDQIGNSAEDLRRFNAELSDLDRSRIDALGNAFDGLGVALRGFGQAVLAQFAGVIEGVVRAVSSGIGTLNGIIQSIADRVRPVLDAIGRSFASAQDSVSSAVNAIARAFTQFGQAVEPVIDFLVRAAQSAFPGFVNALSALGEVVSRITTTFVQGFTAAREAVGGLVESFGRLLGFDTISDFATGIGEAYQFLYNALVPVIEAVGDFIDIAIRFATVIVTGTVKAIQSVVDLTRRFLEFTGLGEGIAAIGNVILRIFGSVGDTFRLIGQLVGGTVGRLLSIAESFLGIDRSVKAANESTKAYEQSTRSVNKAIEQVSAGVREVTKNARDFGEAGQAAAGKFDASISLLKKNLDRGLIDEETYRNEIIRATQEYNKQIEVIKEARDESQKKAEDEIKNIDKIIEKFQEQQEAQRRFGTDGDQKRIDAATNVAKIETEIARVQKLRIDALNSGNLADAEAARQRLVSLEQVLKRESDIASGRAKADEDAKKRAEEEDRRIEKLLDSSDKSRELNRSLQDVQNKIARVQKENAGLFGQLDAASKLRIRELQTLQNDLQEKLRATAQGFDDGFGKAFESTQKKFTELRRKAEDFGEAGEDAAEKLFRGIEEAQELARSGVFNKEQFEEQVAQQQKIFQQELDNIKKAADERKKINEFVDKQIQAFRFGGDQQRGEAAQRAIDIEKEIVRVQKEIQAARQAGDKDAVEAGIKRIGQLDQVLAKENDIASGRKKLEEDIAKERDKALQQQQQQIQQQQKKVQEEQRKAAEAEFNRQRSRIRDLNTLGAGVIQGVDLRSNEGASLFQQLTANAQDPALIEARLQSRRLGELVNLVAGLTNLPIRTIGALGVG
jgi:methyl-accepting chemotaxis protein